MLRPIPRTVGMVLFGVFWSQSAFLQVADEDRFWGKSKATPQAIDFSKMFEAEKTGRDAFEDLKRQKELKLRERMAQPEAIETTVNPKTYVVGPGDIFSFNVWGPMEVQYPISVNPEGKLLVPSVGELSVSERSLEEVQREVVDRARPFYDKSTITLSLEAVRFFRVHVVGEVKYPGTYIAQAMNRVTDLIDEAGGVTEWAWKREIELRRPDGPTDTLDLDAFEQTGSLEQNRVVGGGDVIYIPPIDMRKSIVTVEGNIKYGGVYQIKPGESGLSFLQRIRALNRNSDLAKIVILRPHSNATQGKNRVHTIYPFQSADSSVFFPLCSGDRIVLAADLVYVRGAVMSPGAYPYVPNMKAKDYAGMAGGDYRSTNIKGVKVFHASSGKSEKGPNALVEAGDVVFLSANMDEKIRNYITIIPVFTSLILAAKAAGLMGAK
jgi:protein involved in polysaccharide export with SLBB domain